jgi:hypothetical protein
VLTAYGFRDPDTGALLLVELGDVLDRTGSFSFALEGLGLVFGSAPASVEALPAGTFRLDYDGAVLIDSNAVLDPLFGLNRSSGERLSGSAVLVGTVNTGALTADLRVTVDGAAHHLVDPGVLPVAERVASRVVAALRNQDWESLWSLMANSWQDVGKAEFIGRMREGLAERGRILDVAAGRLEHADGRAGLDVAHTPLVVTTERDGKRAELRATLVLGWEPGDGWKVTTMTPEGQ